LYGGKPERRPCAFPCRSDELCCEDEAAIFGNREFLDGAYGATEVVDWDLFSAMGGWWLTCDWLCGDGKDARGRDRDMGFVHACAAFEIKDVR
jgi:hypothetical protein